MSGEPHVSLVVADGERRRRRRSLGWIAGVITVAAAVALVYWAVGPGDKRTTIEPAAAGPTRAERAAAAYVEVYASYDRPQLKALLAGNALRSWPRLRDANRADEAIEFRILPDTCTVLDRSVVGTRVNCAFDVHALGSEQLGRGPYSNNLFVLDVRDGTIVRSQMVFDYDNNGFNVDMWEPFAAWVARHYPEDVPAMFGGDDARPEAGSAKLFHQHIADYIAAASS